MNNVKIICTVGPASQNPAILKKLGQAGADAFRINFSHGTLKEHKNKIDLIRSLEKLMKRPVAIIQDLQGPRIRIGRLRNPITLKHGEEILVTGQGTKNGIPLNTSSVLTSLKKGHRILIQDGKIQLIVRSVSSSGAKCVVTQPGTIIEHKGVNLPDTDIRLPSLTSKDKIDLQFGFSQNVDFIALSFVRNAEDILNLKRMIHNAKKDIPVIAKLEKPEAIKNLTEILKVSDGVIVARGDLGVEMSQENIPLLQKEIISQSNQSRIPVIVATQMLESMLQNPQPTRAEASDVANAVFDGADGLMLTGETAIGKYPVEAVQAMDRIIHSAETSEFVHKNEPIPSESGTVQESICWAASAAASFLNANAIVAFTETGNTARILSKIRSTLPIIAFTPRERTLRRLSLYRGVLPKLVRAVRTTDDMIREVDVSLLRERLAKKGELLVIVSGVPVRKSGTTNMMKVHRIGEKI